MPRFNVALTVPGNDGKIVIRDVGADTSFQAAEYAKKILIASMDAEVEKTTFA